MQDRDRVYKVAAEWILKAENDLVNAAHTLKLGAKCPSDTVCFHAQQCVEKYLKAALTLNKIDFPKTHSIASLLDKIPSSMRPSLSEREQELLSEYAAVTRYPGDYEPITLTEARKAAALARRVRSAMRKQFPKEILKARSK